MALLPDGSQPNSSGNGSATSAQKSRAELLQELDASSTLENRRAKLHLANLARMMADNQQVLNTTTTDDRALRQQRHRFREAQLANFIGTAQPLTFPEDNMGDILIDSPTTHNYVAPTPPAAALPPASKAQSLLSKAAPWLLGAAGGLSLAGLGAAGASLLSSPPANPPSVNKTVNTTSGFLIELMQPKK